MNRKVLWVIVLFVLVLVLLFLVSKSNKTAEIKTQENQTENSETLVSGTQEGVKEFTMTSFVEAIDGKYYPQYSLKDITVKKGDKVRIKITVTSGMHDFKIDEYGVYADTQLNKESVVEFTADKTGKFVYYCTKPGHRENGQWGTLTVTE